MQEVRNSNTVEITEERAERVVLAAVEEGITESTGDMSHRMDELASLAKAAPGLEYLYLSGKNITDFTPLQSMQLKKLAIHDISKETRTALEEMLPDVEITAR